MIRPLPLLLAATLAAQEPRTPAGEVREVLRVGQTVDGVLRADDAPLAGRGPSKRFQLVPDSKGPVTLSLESYDFDAFLRVETAEGARIAEDDDGGIETNARVVLPAIEHASLVVVAAGAHAADGRFSLVVSEGISATPFGTPYLDAAIEFRSIAAGRALAMGKREAAREHLLREGNLRGGRSQFARARECYERSLDLARDLDDPLGEARAIGSLGNVCLAVGSYPAARDRYLEILPLFTERGRFDLIATTLANLGAVHHRLGDYANAREQLQQCLDLAIEHDLHESHAGALANLGNLHYSLGDYETAREYYAGWRDLAIRHKFPAGRATATGSLGNTFRSLGEHEKARENLLLYLVLSQEIGDDEGEATALVSLADLYYTMGDRRSAREYATRALSAQEKRGIELDKAYPLATLARIELAEGNGNAAAAAIRRATAILETAASIFFMESAEASGVRSEFAHLGEIEQDVADHGVRRGDRDSAEAARAVEGGFAAAARWKSWGLLRGIAEHRDARSAEVNRLRRQRREALAEGMGILQLLAVEGEKGGSAESRRALREEAESLLGRARELDREIQRISPRDAALDLPARVDVRAVREALPGPRDGLVEYAAGESRLYGYRLTSDRLEFFDLGERREIEVEVQRFLETIADPGRGLGTVAEVVDAGRQVFERLLAPILAGAGEGIERLVVVPSALLAAVPFEALVSGVKGEGVPKSFADVEFVIDRLEIVYAPSTAVFVELSADGARKSAGRALVLADPRYRSESKERRGAPPASGGGVAPASGRRAGRSAQRREDFLRLPGTREEAFAIAQVLVGEDEREAKADLFDLGKHRDGSLSTRRMDLHLGAEASPSKLAVDLRAYAVLHIAAHGYVDAEFPQQTGIALSFTETEEGYFAIADALELDLDADLVVLSGCDTARGQVRKGEGVESLARAFMYAGSRAVVASLWQVPDWAAAKTMSAFYRDAPLLEGTGSLPSALREAKRTVRRSAEIRGVRIRPGDEVRSPFAESGHPFFWAPFIYIGLPQ